MQILVLGGTGWLSGTIVTSALAQGHDLTCLARGRSGAVPEGAALVRADREDPDAYDDVARHAWDVVVDVASQPGQVRRAAAALEGTSERYVYVSSGSVYADHSFAGADESADLLPALAADRMESLETYGEAKVACEEAVVAAFGRSRASIVRAGLIGGAGDTSDRSGYWPMRFAHPGDVHGRVLAPDAPDQSAQLIDVRDLAAWIVTLAVRGVTGTFNATGDPIPLAEHLDAARRVGGHRGEVVAVDQDWLLAHDVNPWMGEHSIPLWLPMPDYAGFGARDNGAARGAGLLTRPLDETLADVLRWEVAAGVDRPRKAGLSAADERDLLAAALGRP